MMVSEIVTRYLRNLAMRMEDGLVDWQYGPKIYDMADVTQIMDLAATLDEERGSNLTETLHEFAKRGEPPHA